MVKRPGSQPTNEFNVSQRFFCFFLSCEIINYIWFSILFARCEAFGLFDCTSRDATNANFFFQSIQSEKFLCVETLRAFFYDDSEWIFDVFRSL